MSIGLYDLDMRTYVQVPINLELAKLSTYYKKKREIVTISPSFQPSRFSKFIIRKDYDDGNYPKNLLKYSNIEYGGYAFSNDKYAPLPLEIETQQPDLTIYERYRQVFGKNKEYERAFQTMIGAEHFRLSLDGKTVWKDFKKQLKNPDEIYTMFVHDKNLNEIEGAYEALKELADANKGLTKGYLAMKFPVIVDNAADLLKWCYFKPTRNYFSLQYNGIIDDATLVEFSKYKWGKSFARQLDYIVTAGYKDEADFVANGLSKIFKQITFLRMQRIKISLKYEDNFFLDPKWERLLRLFECYNNTAQGLEDQYFKITMKYDSLYSFCCSIKEQPLFKKDIFGKQEVRELFQFVREKNYEVFCDFYDCHLVTLKDGEFVKCEDWT